MSLVTYIGKTNYRNSIPFGIKSHDRTGHIYCLGKTGSGKSTLLLNMAISDINQGNGIGILDPHGDLATEILDYVPNDRIDDVMLFDVSDSEFPIAFNPLYNVSPEQYHLVASSIVLTFKKVWSDSWGPRLEHILRNTVMTLLYCPNATLLDIQRLLINSEFRQDAINHVTDQSLRDFWYKEFLPMPAFIKSEAVSPIVNKVGLLNIHPILRNILGQPKSIVRFDEIINSKKIFIANLSKGYLGEAATQFLGSLIVTQFQTSALERARQPQEARTPFYLFIDEMHLFITLSFCEILSESRKYGLCLFLTHQFIDQIHEDIRKAIFGNIGTLICFRIGGSDAEQLEKEFYPVFTKEDLISLPRFHIYLKLMIDGTSSHPFSATTLPISQAKSGLQQSAVQNSRKKYSKKKREYRHEDTYRNGELFRS